MRLEILDKIHEGHQGIPKCRERAKSSVWGPGLSREIQDLHDLCTTQGQQTRATHRNTLARSPMANRGHRPFSNEGDGLPDCH